MLDQILLAPYYITLKIRHALYDSGIRKVHTAEIPTVSVGNVTVGGTGKTPHTEMLLRLLSGHPEWAGKHLAVLSRGYGRKSRGFQQVVAEYPAQDSKGRQDSKESPDKEVLAGQAGPDKAKKQGKRHRRKLPAPAAYFGDEPVQIKKKFPQVTVAVDKDRVEGCDFLKYPDRLQTSKKGKKCLYKDFPAADLAVLDDAFQYRRLKPSVSLVLVNYNRPVSKDHLLPVGRLRDLPERLAKADMLTVTKCPYYMEDEEKEAWATELGIKEYDPASCTGRRKDGKEQALFFTTVRYDTLAPIFPEGDQRYAYSKQAILFSGIADDTPLMRYLTDTYKIVRHLTFGDHHEFTAGDMGTIRKAAEEYPTAVLVTTEKDSQRLAGIPGMAKILKERMFFAPIKAEFVSEGDQERFMQVLTSHLCR